MKKYDLWKKDRALTLVGKIVFTAALGSEPVIVGLLVTALAITGIFFKARSGAAYDFIVQRKTLLAGVTVFGLIPFFYLLVTQDWYVLPNIDRKAHVRTRSIKEIYKKMAYGLTMLILA